MDCPTIHIISIAIADIRNTPQYSLINFSLSSPRSPTFFIALSNIVLLIKTTRQP